MTELRHGTVLQSAEYITQHADYVTLGESDSNKSVKGAAAKLYKIMCESEALEKSFDPARWRDHDLHPSRLDEATLDWIFTLDTLNFCFWAPKTSDREADAPPPPLFTVDHRGKSFTGYWSLCAVLNRALDDGIPITSAEYMANVTEEDLAHVFRSSSSSPVPLLKERCRSLNEAGKVLLKHFDGKFIHCLEKANGSAANLLSLVVENFTSYQDCAQYKGRKVWFLKRAQILIADIWAAFTPLTESSDSPPVVGLSRFHDIDTLTMFADYRVPQVLVHLGAMHYSGALLQRLREDPYLPSGDPLEGEIRGCSIWAVELMAREIETMRKERARSRSHSGGDDGDCVKDIGGFFLSVFFGFFFLGCAQNHFPGL
eukprot:TRINITY_DN11022_c0_g1_i2.p1 TRINITY_DN11022_c0_g1~~TRINITY_DN11022_c0_g1_i2.p1  ORF type:complete len:416 (+),score=32.99 TRINITY_DN11022_c0_g1_i2:134-1249(+)